MAGNDSDGEELLAHPPGIALQWEIKEEELALRCEVPLNEEGGACFSSEIHL